MNKRLLLLLTILIILLLIIIPNINKNTSNNKQVNNTKPISNNNEHKEENIEVKAIINNKEYIVNLEDNETVKGFLAILPKSLNMKELNGNEKYINLEEALPVDEYYPKKIIQGDIMLFGDNCLVIFYKSFDTQYSYTKIGHIDNLPNLGNEDIKVEFKK